MGSPEPPSQKAVFAVVQFGYDIPAAGGEHLCELTPRAMKISRIWNLHSFTVNFILRAKQVENVSS